MPGPIAVQSAKIKNIIQNISTNNDSIFTASESFDIGMDKGSAVAMEYHDRIPFEFNGKIEKVTIKYSD